MSDTPRTDSHFQGRAAISINPLDYEFIQTLERELAAKDAAKDATIEKLRSALEQANTAMWGITSNGQDSINYLALAVARGEVRQALTDSKL